MNIWIFTAHMLLFKVVSSTECLSPNVRTVIWRNTDLYRSCWNDRDIAVLYARRLFQLILPIRVPSKMNHLVAHFKMCLEVVRDLATTKETHAMMVRPMADVIGGYLQSFAIPIANQEYYEGNLTYSTASQMNELLKGIKKILSTDGGKWTQPIRVLPSNEICAYQVIPPSPIENRCSELISSVDLRHKCKSEKELGWTSARVPLPFLDNSNTPQSIAVPFRTKTLYSLYDRDSSDILMRYYTAASHCYTTTCGAQGGITQEQRDFDRSFHDWILKSIVPHLHNGHWYPAFGGVYRILKHMTDEGFSFPDHQDAGPLAIQGRCLHQQVMAKTSWFFVACICGFLLMFWIVVCVVWRTRQKGRIVRIPDDNIITYNYHCDSEHSEDILKAIVKTIVEDSSADSFVEGVCNCQVSNDSICNCKDCNCVMPPQSQEDSQSLAA